MSDLRTRTISKPLFKLLKKQLPAISDTEQQALEAGGTWWDAELMSGKPDWQKLLDMPSDALSGEEQAFIDGPVKTVCNMVDDWDITFKDKDLPPEVWQFLKESKFFGMIIPKRYGGLGFSAQAHSEVVCRLATASTTLAVTVMVPNSLGPAELLLEYGTEQQKNYYLPRLAKGEEIPCFGLTSAQAGSDASAMIDKGVVCYGDVDGEKTLGMRLNWSKRYITLGPVATLIGLAFKLYDPDKLLGQQEDLGITVALINTQMNGVVTGRRHYPAFQAFQNGPVEGHDVFVPLENIIGGRDNVGQGWKMLMSALAAGRSISLPSLSAAGCKLATCSTGGYSRIREQFSVPIGKFEGVERRLANIATTTYLLEAGRKVTTQAIDQGHHPAVISAILKAHSTYRFRDVLNDAMDVHGGKTICDGPNNYLGNVYRAVPVAITVEGANILTRNLIIYGQGAIRCHPYLLQEIQLMKEEENDDTLKQFDTLIFRHFRHQLGLLARAWWHSWTGGLFASTPQVDRKLKPFYRQLSRYSSVLSLTTEFTLVSLGGELKKKESISARLGDVLSELYLLSCVLKHQKDESSHPNAFPLMEWLMQKGFNTIQRRLDSVYRNFPIRPLGWLMRFLMLPLGVTQAKPNDKLTHKCADLILSPNEIRARLVEGVHIGEKGVGLQRIEAAFLQTCACEPLRERLRRAEIDDVNRAVSEGVISEYEAHRLNAAEKAVQLAIEVDSYDPLDLTGQRSELEKRRHTH